MSSTAQLLILVAVIGLFWLLMMRPARNQQRAMRQLQANLAVGDRVVLSAGIFGTVRSVEEGKVDLEIAPGTVITVASQVVVRRVEDEEEAAPEPGSADETSAESEEGRSTAKPGHEAGADDVGFTAGPVTHSTTDEEK